MTADPSCPVPGHSERIRELEVRVEDLAALAKRLSAIERDVDSIGREMRRLRAVLLGDGDGEEGGLRAEVHAQSTRIGELTKTVKMLTWGIAALVGVLGPEQLVRLAAMLTKMMGAP